MKSTFFSLIGLLLLAGTFGLAMWVGYLVQKDILLTLVVLLVSMLLVGLGIYRGNCSILHLPQIFARSFLIETLVVIVEVAKIARKNVLAIEEVLPSIANAYMRDGLRLVVDRVDRFLILDILDVARESANEREEQWLRQWKSMSYLVLILGFLLSAYQIIRGPNFELMGYQFFPALLGALICVTMVYFSFPLRGLLESRAVLRQMTLDGVLLIEKNERPEFIEQMLLGYFPPQLWKTYEKLKQEWMKKRVLRPKTESPVIIQDVREINTPGGIQKIEEVLAKVDSKDSITPDVIDEIEEVLATELEVSKFDGVAAMSELLHTVGESTQSRILSMIEKSSPELAKQIKEENSAFENLVQVDALGTQAILKETPQIVLVRSLTTASEKLKEHIYQNMSKRAADMVRDDIDALGTVDIADAVKAQQKMVSIARRLEAEGKIQLSLKS
jgi:flagellar motor component MotA